MKKGLLPLTLAAIVLAACGGKQSSATATAADSAATNVQAAWQTNTYLSTIDSFLVNELGKLYAEGEYCVPTYTIVGVDSQRADDVLVWGDFWVFNYNQAGDTLKCVAGGSHPGLMHLRKAGGSYEVTAFERVEDGSRNLPTAKKIFGTRYDAFHTINSNEEVREAARAAGLAEFVKKHGIKASLYQDYGWPAKKLE